MSLLSSWYLPPRCLLLGSAALLAGTASAATASAEPPQASQTPAIGSDQQAQASEANVPDDGPTIAAPALPARTGRDPAKFKAFDALAEPGATTNFPGSIDTVLGDAGGFRSFLADHDIGLQSRTGVSLVGDLLATGQPRSPQRFNGQRLTLQSHSANAIATIGLNGLGLPNSKLIVGVSYLVTSYRVNGPTTVTVRNLAYYQSFAHDLIDLKVGYMPNYYEFVGLFTGGSPVLSSGFSGLIPIQVGLSADPTPTPLANVTLNGKNGLYLKVGVQRSISPQGSSFEVEHNGFAGLKFGQRGSGPLTIAEVGIRRAASATGRQIWLRAGGIYNDSDYARFDGKGTQSNKALYGLADMQLTQPDEKQPFRGIYGGVSAFWASSKVNAYVQTYEARVYSIGPSASRPNDSVSFRITYNKYSKDGRYYLGQQGQYVNPYQLSGTLNYSYHARAGVYLIPSLAYIRHPSFIGDFKDALNLSGTIYVLL
jgi:porin